MTKLPPGPYREDLLDLTDLCRKALDAGRRGEDAHAFHMEMDRRMMALIGQLVARELPEAVFPPPQQEAVWSGYVCGGPPPNAREYCKLMLWICSYKEDEAWSRQFSLYVALTELDLFHRPFPSRAPEKAVEAPSRTGASPPRKAKLNALVKN